MSSATKTIQIEGMSCGHCVKAVREALEKLEGVTVHVVDIGTASLEIDDHESAIHDVARAIAEAGYTLKQS